MENVSKFILKNRGVFILMFIALIVFSLIMLNSTTINYNSTEYLPEDSRSAQALTVMEEEFGLFGSSQFMVKQTNLYETQSLINDIGAVEGVSQVIWLNEVLGTSVLDAITQMRLDPAFETSVQNYLANGGQLNTSVDGLIMLETFNIPLSSISVELENNVQTFYLEDNSLVQVVFTEDDYSQIASNAITDIRVIIGEDKVSVRGVAYNAMSSRLAVEEQMLLILLYFIPVVLLILLLTTKSFIEPLVFLIVAGIAILLNMGTNFIFPSVSFNTYSISALLQLAISMDYAVFFLHRFAEEKKKGVDVKKAINVAYKKSFSPVVASATTTIAGFVALLFMQFSIGKDMGLVLGKGIVFSLLTVFILMPIIILYAYKLIEKFKHKSLIPSFKKLSNAIFKLRFVLTILIIIIAVPSFIAQSNNSFIYGESANSLGENSQLTIDLNDINEVFGVSNQVTLLVEKGNYTNEYAVIQALLQKDYVNANSVKGIALLTNGANPDDLVLGGFMTSEQASLLKSQFESENYALISFSTNLPEESKESFEAVEDIYSIVENNYSNYHMLGASPVIDNIKTVVESDYNVVVILTIVLVFLILLLTFKNIFIALVLVLIIQSAIWINMCLPYLMGASLVFIGYLLISIIQLGVTIDYGILLTSRYVENRKTLYRKESLKLAVQQSLPSVLTSGLIMIGGGLILWQISSMTTTSAIGQLMFNGTLLSLFMVIFVLPQTLYIFDKIVIKKKLRK